MHMHMRHRRTYLGGVRAGVIVLASFLCTLAGCTSPRSLDRSNPGATLTQLSSWLQGSFKDERRTRLDVRRVWPERSDGVWLLAEQGFPAHSEGERPFERESRQGQERRLLHLVETGRVETGAEDGREAFTLLMLDLPVRKTLSAPSTEPESPTDTGPQFDLPDPDTLDMDEAWVVQIRVGADGAYDGISLAKAGVSGTDSQRLTRVRIDPARIDWWERELPPLERLKDPGGGTPVVGERGVLRRFQRVLSEDGTSAGRR